MSLPKVEFPTYNTKVPSTGETVYYRPYTVSEEKVFLHAAESGDTEQIQSTIKQVLEACYTTTAQAANPITIDTNKLTTFDVDWLYLQLRAKSIGEEMTVTVQFNNCPNNDNKLCKHMTKLPIRVEDIKLVSNEKGEEVEWQPPKGKSANWIKFSSALAIKLRYPNFSDLSILGDIATAAAEQNLKAIDEHTYRLMAKCTLEFYENKNGTETSTAASAHSQDELVEWYKALQKPQFAKIEKFFSSVPTISYTKTIKCSKCEREQEYKLEGLADFFG